MAKRKKSKQELPEFDYEQIVKDVARMQLATQHIPALVNEEVRKSWKQLPNTDAQRAPKTWFNDPLSLQYSLGYKDRRYSLTYDTLKRTAGQLSIIAAIINTRAAQLAAFCQPYRWTKSLGFAIKHKDPDHATTPAEVAFIKELEAFILNCGRMEKNPYSNHKRDDFETFMRKLVRDSLTFDQAAFELVYDRLGIPFEFLAVDASTIRIASDDDKVGVNSSWHDRGGLVPGVPARFNSLWQGQQYGQDNVVDKVSYVQVINGQIENVYSDRELAFGVRNPRSDIYVSNYGLGEIEQIITIVTSYLHAEQYNSNFFTSGSNPKGLINIKGDNLDQDQLEGFRRHWKAMAQGVENAWVTPVLQTEGLEWVDFNKSNQEMEFGKWIEFLMKIICGVYLIDPSEIGFDMHGGQSQTPLFESSAEWKIKASRDKGLKPLLRFFAKFINVNIIDKIDDHFTFEFVGLDELSENEKHELLVEQIASYMTLNEARASLDLQPLVGGDLPLNPTYLQALQVQGLDAASQQMQQNQQSTSDQGQPADQPPVDNGGPKYSALFQPDTNGQ